MRQEVRIPFHPGVLSGLLFALTHTGLIAIALGRTYEKYFSGALPDALQFHGFEFFLTSAPVAAVIVPVLNALGLGPQPGEIRSYIIMDLTLISCSAFYWFGIGYFAACALRALKILGRVRNIGLGGVLVAASLVVLVLFSFRTRNPVEAVWLAAWLLMTWISWMGFPMLALYSWIRWRRKEIVF